MKALNDLTIEEHKELITKGLLWDMYPEATGNYRKDLKDQLAKKYYQLKREINVR